MLLSYLVNHCFAYECKLYSSELYHRSSAFFIQGQMVNAVSLERHINILPALIIATITAVTGAICCSVFFR